jgi:hypothetical protein
MKYYLLENAMRHIFIWIYLLLFIITVSAQETDSNFEFWVSEHPYYQGRLSYLQVNQDGEIIDQFSVHDFGIRGSTSGSNAISVSGRYFATIFSQSFSDEPDHLVIYDTQTDTIIMNTPVDSDRHAHLHFVDDQHILHALVRDGGTWLVELISIPDGNVLNSITSDDSTALGLEVIRDWPYPRTINLDAITSNGVRIVLDYIYVYSPMTFQWLWEDNSLSTIERFGRTTYLRNGNLYAAPHIDDRLLFNLELDERFDQYPYGFGYGNSVHIMDVEAGQHMPIFSSSTDTILETYWIQNGERLLLALADKAHDTPHWIVIERDGTVIQELFTGRVENIMPTPDGFLFNTKTFLQIPDVTPENQSEPHDTIYHFNTRIMTYRNYLAELRHGPERELSPEIIWSRLDHEAPLPPVTPLLPALPDNTLTETLPLRVDGSAYISIQNGESLNLRDAPALDAAIVAHLQNNQRVILIDEPQQADGYTWWSVWVDRSRRGWVVERVDNEMTLRPPDITRDTPLTLVEANLIQGNTGVAPLALRMRVRVVSDEAIVREQTGLQSRASDVLLRNAQMTIIGGPFSDDDLIWWQIEADTDTVGWIEEVTETGVIQLAPVG